MAFSYIASKTFPAFPPQPGLGLILTSSNLLSLPELGTYTRPLQIAPTVTELLPLLWLSGASVEMRRPLTGVITLGISAIGSSAPCCGSLAPGQSSPVFTKRWTHWHKAPLELLSDSTFTKKAILSWLIWKCLMTANSHMYCKAIKCNSVFFINTTSVKSLRPISPFNQ